MYREPGWNPGAHERQVYYHCANSTPQAAYLVVYQLSPQWEYNEGGTGKMVYLISVHQAIIVLCECYEYCIHATFHTGNTLLFQYSYRVKIKTLFGPQILIFLRNITNNIVISCNREERPT